MPLRTCETDGCKDPAERGAGSCIICARHYCVEHKKKSYHKCPSESDDDNEVYWAAYDSAKIRHLAALLDRINVNAMETIIGQVRGVKCRIPVLDADLDQAAKIEIVSSQMGGQNCHVDAEFEDGVAWIVRIRLANPTLPPQKVQDEILLSEVATLKFLEQTAVPVPKVYYHQLESENDTAGASFIVMEKLPGRALEWNETNSEQREKIMEQLATIFLEPEKYPFEKTGSIVSTNSGFDIGPHAQLPFFESPISRLGPWSDLDNAYSAIIQQQLQAINSKEIATLPEENRGYFQWLLSALPSLLSSTKSATGPFYLKHFDDKGDHILIDEQYNITGIIDWEFASTESKGLAFSAPCMMWPVGEFYDGKNDLSRDELKFVRIFKQRGREDIADIVLGGRPWQRSLFFLGGLPKEREEFDGLFRGLQKSFLSIV